MQNSGIRSNAYLCVVKKRERFVYIWLVQYELIYD